MLIFMAVKSLTNYLFEWSDCQFWMFAGYKVVSLSLPYTPIKTWNPGIVTGRRFPLLTRFAWLSCYTHTDVPRENQSTLIWKLPNPQLGYGRKKNIIWGLNLIWMRPTCAHVKSTTNTATTAKSNHHFIIWYEILWYLIRPPNSLTRSWPASTGGGGVIIEQKK